ncbi:hypothetical protein [Paenibacillus sp. FSL M8-0142]|uniref:hypothetical protein n=1 Tax=Paenibacillus sp. FSL M8-0142 TaxID=2954525 RepID=UPI00315B1253
MNIREWFGCSVQYDPSTNFNQSLDDLLKLYADALTRYLKIDSAPDVQGLIIEASGNQLTRGQMLFLDWFESKGLPSVQSLANITEVANEQTAVAEISYEAYILKEEMDFDYPEDVRSSLITISNELQSTINEVSITIEEPSMWESFIVKENPLFKWVYEVEGITESISINYKLTDIETTYSLELENIIHDKKKIPIKEPAIMQVSFFCLEV